MLSLALGLGLTRANGAPGATLPLFSAALAKTVANTADTKVLCLGSSVVVGVGAQNATHTNNRAGSWPTYLAAAWRTRGYSCQADTLVCDGNSGKWDDVGGYTQAQRNAQMIAAEPRLNMTGSNWNVANFWSMGGSIFQNTADTTSVLTWTPTATCDGAIIKFQRTGGARSFTVTRDGGTAVTGGASIDASGTASVGSVTVSFPAGTHTIEIKRLAGGIRILQITPTYSVTKRILVANAGRGSASTVDLTSTGTSDPAFYPTVAQTAFAADLTIINGLELNDQTSNQPPTGTFKTNLTTIIGLAKATGDCVLTLSHPRDPTVDAAQLYQLAAYNAVIQERASALGCLLVDFRDAIPTYVAAGVGSDYFDNTHLLASGYSKEATLLDTKIAAAI